MACNRIIGHKFCVILCNFLKPENPQIVEKPFQSQQNSVNSIKSYDLRSLMYEVSIIYSKFQREKLEKNQNNKIQRAACQTFKAGKFKHWFKSNNNDIADRRSEHLILIFQNVNWCLKIFSLLLHGDVNYQDRAWIYRKDDYRSSAVYLMQCYNSKLVDSQLNWVLR